MTSNAAALQRYAHAVARERLRRREALLARMTPAERSAVEELALAIARRVAESLTAEPLVSAWEANSDGSEEPSVDLVSSGHPLSP